MSSPASVLDDDGFGLDELFISTTDPKAIIAMGNEVFLRVSGYEQDEIVGSAHNVVRHPDMPRAAFRLFWEHLEAELPVAVYVKNRRKDGSAYWVIALAVAVPGGYVSVRMKPSSPLFDAARELYADLRAFEETTEAGDVRRRKTTIAASRERLDALLADTGFDGYEAFMRQALPAEVASRKAGLGRVVLPEARANDLWAISRRCAELHGMLEALIPHTQRFSAAGKDLGAAAGSVSTLAATVRLFALNLGLSVARMADGQTLGTIADTMSVEARGVLDMASRIAGCTERSGVLLDDAAFRVASAQLLVEMMAHYVTEADAAGSGRSDEQLHQLALLAGALESTIGRLTTALRAIDLELEALRVDAQRLGAVVRRVHALEVNGRVEVGRHRDAEQLEGRFAEVAEQLAEAAEGLELFDEARAISVEFPHRLPARLDAAAGQLTAAITALTRP